MATNTELRGIFMYVPTRNTFQKTTGSGRTLLSEERGTSLLWPAILISIAALVIAVSPVSAGEQYMSGSPELSAYLGGTNEFSPGQEVQIAVVVENSGLNQFKFVKTGIVDREDLPNTAKFLTVTL